MITYLAEIAGKDSIAAVHKFIRENNVDLIIPTIVYTGTEYGNVESYYNSIEYISKYGDENNITIGKPIELHDEKLWNLLCIRFQHQLHNKYGFYTPCVMCHLFTHLLRIPLLYKSNASGIITGERHSHNGRIKMNQHLTTIECFDRLFKKHNIFFKRPLFDIHDTNIIDNEIKDYAYLTSINDVKCILSENLNDYPYQENNALYQLTKFLSEYVFKLGDYILECYYGNKDINYDKLEKIIKRSFE